jgi:phosphonate transport system substrate-binding protein
VHNLARTFFVFLCILGSAASAAQSGEQQPLILGVHPYLPHDEIVTRFTPLANYISRSIGRPVEVRVGTTYDEHIKAIGRNEIDVAYMGPVPYVEMVAKYGRKPLLVRQVINDSPYLRGEIIVRKDSRLRTLSDLKGKCFLFGDVNSTMSYIMPQHMLEGAGVPLNRLGDHKFLEGHENVALAILAGTCDAGAVKQEVYQEFEPKGLRVLAELPLVHDHLFVTSAKLPPSLVRKLRKVMLDLNVLPEGKAIMTKIHPDMTALVPPKDSEYDNLRAVMKLRSKPPSVIR